MAVMLLFFYHEVKQLAPAGRHFVGLSAKPTQICGFAPRIPYLVDMLCQDIVCQVLWGHHRTGDELNMPRHALDCHYPARSVLNVPGGGVCGHPGGMATYADDASIESVPMRHFCTDLLVHNVFSWLSRSLR